MINLDNSLFNINVNVDSARPQTGGFIVAEPFLREEYFNHAVILLADYNPGKPAMGLVMNRNTDYMLHDVLDINGIKEDIPVYCGGPLSTDRLFYVHRMPDLIEGSTPLSDGLWIGGDFDQVCSYISQGMPTEGNIRFFVGYSGWDAGQLEEEISNHVWAPVSIPDKFDVLTGEEDSYWHAVVRRLGKRFSGWRLQPMNPENN